MYAFGPLPRQKRTGRVIGTHQKIDRVARRHFSLLETKKLTFPGIRSILHFEGSRGPDGIKLKSPGNDEPWHFIDPDNITDSDSLLEAIDDHILNLTEALVASDEVRAAFEAAWLARAVTDGLTPAHHEPLHEQLKHIKVDEDRNTKVRSKIVMSGNGSGRQFIRNNWQYWGAKGIMTTHTLFEAGVATTAKPRAFNSAAIGSEEISSLKKDGFRRQYIAMVKDIAQMDMYTQFKRDGWTRTLATDTTRILIPTIIQAVTLAWYEAYDHALERIN